MQKLCFFVGCSVNFVHTQYDSKSIDFPMENPILKIYVLYFKNEGRYSDNIL